MVINYFFGDFFKYYPNWALVLLAVFICGCAHAQEPSLSKSCQLPEGTLTVLILSGLDEWHYSWEDSTATLTEDDEKIRNNQINRNETHSRGQWDEKKAGVDKLFLGPQSRLDVPFRVSPNENWLAVAVYPDEMAAITTTNLALINRMDRTVVRKFQFPHYIEALAWSPSGQFLAVLLEDFVSGPTTNLFRDWLGAIGGHPSSYSTFRVSIYDIDGGLLCSKLFREKVPDGGGYLEWNLF